jgi:hypothetical protein
MDLIPAVITVRGRDVMIDAKPSGWRQESSCRQMGAYSPDHFAGRFARPGVIEMLNTDDAGYAHNRGYQFWRVSCSL